MAASSECPVGAGMRGAAGGEGKGCLCPSLRPEQDRDVLGCQGRGSQLDCGCPADAFAPAPAWCLPACLVQDPHHAAPGLRGAPVCQVAGAA